MTENTTTSPAIAANTNPGRLQYLDFLRGFAVLGLLLMNMPFMGIAELGYLSANPTPIGDSLVRGLNSLFFDGRFRNLFCLLFGIGIYLQMQSYRARGLNDYTVLKSRMKWLFLFGSLHCILIWIGDILTIYALCGLVILGRMTLSAEELIKKGWTWITIGFAITVVFAYSTTYFEGQPSALSQDYKDLIALSASGYFSDIEFRLAAWLAYILTFPFITLFSLCGVMLLGVGYFKAGYLQTGFTSEQVKRFAVVTLVVSLLDLYLSVFEPEVGQMLPNVLGYISGLTMALLIWHFVVVSKLYESGSFVAQALIRVGRMALTFYILQSLVSTLLFRVFFPEWLSSFQLPEYTLLALIVIICQMLFGYWYQAKPKQGPLEKMWRYLVQRKIAKMEAEQVSQDKA